MSKKIYFLFLIILLFLGACKEQGSEYLTWRNTSALTMVNSYNAYLRISAYKDSVLFKGVHSAIVLGEIVKVSDSLQIVQIGHCVSATNTKPILKTYYEDDTLEAATRFVLGDTGVYFQEIDSLVTTNSKSFKLISNFEKLKIDHEYYVRTYVIVRNIEGVVDTAYNQTTSVFRTKIPQDIWFHKPDFNGDARTEALSFVFNGKAYIGTGFDGLSLKKDFWSYDPQDLIGGPGVWTQVSTFSSFKARKSAVAIVVNDTVYIGTGISDLSTTETAGDMWKWVSPDNYNYWLRIDSLGENRQRFNAVGFSLTASNNKQRAYITTGQRYIDQFNTVYFQDLMYYDPIADTPGNQNGGSWKNISPFGGTGGLYRTEAVVAVIDNRAIVGSGIDNGGNYKNDFYVFDPSNGSGTWRSLNDICPADPRANGVAFSLSFDRNSTTKKYFYFGTGRGETKLYNDWWRYDFSQDKWEQCSDIFDDKDTADAREGAIGFAIVKQHVAYGTLERGFVGLGRNKDSEMKRDMWEYLP